jgi:hypothetical protein
VKSALLFLSFPILLLGAIEGALSFAGCKSSSDSDDGGPACGPDAPFDADIDTHFNDDEQGDAGVCNAACAKQIKFPGCPDPGCVGECQRQLDLCASTLHTGEYLAFLECEETAKFQCEMTPLGKLPVATDCADAAASVATLCVAKEGGVGEAGSCASSGLKSVCESCCQGMFSEGYDTYNVALEHCACVSPAVCNAECSTTFCDDITPTDAGGTCTTCLTKSLLPDGGCGASVSNECSLDSNCMAYEACLTNNCASLK